ncbi:MAG TPA: hypothetical protein VMM60_16950 [Ilumatobacter sp.]|nr:hypothetical protein [Ilumatobacter sp.]
MSASHVSSRGVTRRSRRLIASAVLAGVAAVATPSVAFAVVPNPPADGSAPGAELVTVVLGWLKWAGLASALAGLLIGAITTGIGHFGSNYSASSAGRKWLLGGMGAAILSGLSWTIATTLYTATGG